jgi:hypothetical protein
MAPEFICHCERSEAIHGLPLRLRRFAVTVLVVIDIAPAGANNTRLF